MAANDQSRWKPVFTVRQNSRRQMAAIPYEERMPFAPWGTESELTLRLNDPNQTPMTRSRS